MIGLLKCAMLLYSFETGYIPLNVYNIYTTDAQNDVLCSKNDKVFYTKFGSFLKIKDFTIGGDIRINCWKNDKGMSFFPHKAEFEVKTEYKIKNFILGAKHICVHPIVPYVLESVPTMHYETTYQEIYVKISGKTKIFN